MESFGRCQMTFELVHAGGFSKINDPFHSRSSRCFGSTLPRTLGDQAKRPHNGLVFIPNTRGACQTTKDEDEFRTLEKIFA